MTQTEQIKAVQRKLGLKDDGIAGNKTWDAIGGVILKGELPVTPHVPSVTPSVRHINDRGLALIKHFEGLYLKAYKDSVGVITIGFGHTGLTHQDGTVYMGRVITEQEAEALLRHDMNAFERRVESFAGVELSDDEFAALVSFDFNTGGLGKSTLLKKLNLSDFEGASNEFLKWDKAGGKTLKGLTRRRKSERNLFLGKDDYIVIV